MFPGERALRPPFEFIVPAKEAERNGLMVYAFGYPETKRLLGMRRSERE